MEVTGKIAQLVARMPEDIGKEPIQVVSTVADTVAQLVVEERRTPVEAYQLAVKLYRHINPDIPFVPEPLETILEDLLLQTVLPRLLQAALDHWTSK